MSTTTTTTTKPIEQKVARWLKDVEKAKLHPDVAIDRMAKLLNFARLPDEHKQKTNLLPYQMYLLATEQAKLMLHRGPKLAEKSNNVLVLLLREPGMDIKLTAKQKLSIATLRAEAMVQMVGDESIDLLKTAAKTLKDAIGQHDQLASGSDELSAATKKLAGINNLLSGN